MTTTEPGRDELIDARAEKERLLAATKTTARAIARLMEDRVRHITALRSIAVMTETGIIAKGGADVHRIAREALDSEADMSWWPEGAPRSDDAEPLMTTRQGRPVDARNNIPEETPDA